MTDKIASNKNPPRTIEVLGFGILILKLFRNSDLEIRNFRNIIPDNILQVLKLSRVIVIGIARKKGIERTKNTVASSSEANSTYIAKAMARYGTIERGKMPVTIKQNKISCPTKTQFKILSFIFYQKIHCILGGCY